MMLLPGLTQTADNYHEAVEILRKRFRNRQLIITQHQETLLSFEPVTEGNHLRNLQYIFDTIKSHIRSLKSLGLKLEPNLRLIVSRNISSDNEMEIGKLLLMFEEALLARERAFNSSTLHAQGRRIQERRRHLALVSGAREIRNISAISCCY